MKDEDEVLNEILESSPPPPRRSRDGNEVSPSQSTSCQNLGGFDFAQWQRGPNDVFRASGVTVKNLPVGMYSFMEDQFGLYIQKFKVITDSLIELPDTANERVLAGMRKFWTMGDRYREHGLLYKRGVLLYGPPGSGKTATLGLLSEELSAIGGIVILCDQPRLCSVGLAQLRRVEPNRKLICILEDIDELIDRFGEHQLLAILDGENQVDNIVMIATTNYPERLGARIINRPARFDERILVGMPSAPARTIYLSKIASALPLSVLSRWVDDTEGLSIAHLRELAAAVLCLEQPYDSVIKRLRQMRILPRERDGQGAVSTGFGGNS